MKKKLFLALALCVILVCTFAISVSATEWFGTVEIIDLDKDGASDISITDRMPAIVEKGNAEGAPASEDARVKISCTCKAGSHTFPAYYLTSPKSTGKRFYCFSYAELNALLPSYCANASAIDGTKILAYEIPNGYTAIYSGFFYDGNTYAAKSIQYFSFATCTTMTSLEGTASGKNWFADSTVQEVNLGTKITNIPIMFLYNCDNLTEFTLPNSVTTIYSLAFAKSGNLERINISKNSALTTLGAQAFGDCTSLEGIYLPTGITSLGYGISNNEASGQSPFNGCTSLYFLNNPGEEKPEIYYFPENLTEVKGEIFKNCKNLNDVLVFPTGVKTVINGWAFSNAKACTLVFLGDVEELSTTGTSWTKQTAIYFCNEADAGYTGATNISSKFVYCNAEGNTTHLYKVAVNTAPTCTEPGVNGTACFCGKPNPDSPSIPATHDYGKELSYNVWVWENDNYFANAKYKHTCQVCAEEYTGAEIENSYLFVKEGFATFENKDGEAIKSYDFQYSIKVNTDAMDDYTEETGKVINYGTVAGVGDSVANPISYKNGELTIGKSAAVSDMTGTDYVKLLIKVTSIPVTQDGVEITCNAYAIVDDKLRYIGDGTVSENAFVSVIK